MVYTFVVSKEEAGRRLDVYLCEKTKGAYSRTFIQRLIVNKEVLLNKKPVRCHYRVVRGDSIHISLSEQKTVQIIPENIPLKIIYEDDDILVIDKPAGLTVHPGAGHGAATLVNALLAHTENLSNVNPERPGIVHRLDRETSGIMVIAKNNSSHLNLIKQFSAHTVKKKYAAIVKGRVEFDEGVIDLPIGRHKRDFRRRQVSFVGSKPALTKYKVLRRLPQDVGRRPPVHCGGRLSDTTFLELIPETGRTHQLRVHLAHMGHPILGDEKYGKPSDFGRLALHAQELGFMHPKSGKYVTFISELPQEFK